MSSGFLLQCVVCLSEGACDDTCDYAGGAHGSGAQGGWGELCRYEM